MESIGTQRNLDKNTQSRINKLVKDYLAIESIGAKEADAICYLPRIMIMATLPHSKPNNHFFQRKNKNYTLTMIGNPQFGLPYGSLPRLFLSWMTRELVNKEAPIPTINLSHSFAQFLAIFNLSQNGGPRGDATRLREQMIKLLTTQISFVYQDEKNGSCGANQFVVTKSFRLWGNVLKNDQCNISLKSTITLSSEFFDELVQRPVPVDFRMLNALRRSPLQIDIYVWLTYRFSYLKNEILIPWNRLKTQFGADYAENAQGLRDFKRQFLKALHVVMVMYSTANVVIEDTGILLMPSPTHVKKQNNKE